MRNPKVSLVALVLAVILSLSMLTANQITTEAGRIETRTVQIHDNEKTLSGLLHIPSEARPDNPRPAVIVTHGISSSKEMIDGISLELARRGIVSMSLDLQGHGDSEGQLSAEDSSFGLEAAANFIRSRDFVDQGLIGLAGHSLGAGAARTVAMGGEIYATAFIAGGVGGDFPQEGELTTINPKNLLVAVGRHDVLFRIEDLTIDLQPVFGVDEPVEPGITYGDFQIGDARRLAVRPTTHLLEPMDPGLVMEVVAWFIKAFNDSSGVNLGETDQIFLWREACLLIALVSLFGVTLLIPKIVQRGPAAPPRKSLGRSDLKKISSQNVFLFWSLPGILLFIPLMGAGAFIPFPPQLFGSSMAWWLFSVAMAGLLILKMNMRRDSRNWCNLKDLVGSFITWRDIVLPSGLIVVMYLATVSTEKFLNLNFRFFVPILNSLRPGARLIAFPTYLPFFLAYYLVDGIYIYILREKTGDEFTDLVNVLGIKLIPYLLAMALQYIPMYATNLRFLPGFIGFILEFVWGILPIFAITTICSWWLNRLTGSIGTGAVFNTILTAWIAASLFPYGSFR